MGRVVIRPKSKPVKRGVYVDWKDITLYVTLLMLLNIVLWASVLIWLLKDKWG